mgnify:FL=1
MNVRDEIIRHGPMLLLGIAMADAVRRWDYPIGPTMVRMQAMFLAASVAYLVDRWTTRGERPHEILKMILGRPPYRILDGQRMIALSIVYASMMGKRCIIFLGCYVVYGMVTA